MDHGITRLNQSGWENDKLGLKVPAGQATEALHYWVKSHTSCLLEEQGRSAAPREQGA